MPWRIFLWYRFFGDCQWSLQFRSVFSVVTPLSPLCLFFSAFILGQSVYLTADCIIAYCSACSIGREHCYAKQDNENQSLAHAPTTFFLVSFFRPLPAKAHFPFCAVFSTLASISPLCLFVWVVILGSSLSSFCVIAQCSACQVAFSNTFPGTDQYAEQRYMWHQGTKFMI